MLHIRPLVRVISVRKCPILTAKAFCFITLFLLVLQVPTPDQPPHKPSSQAAAVGLGAALNVVLVLECFPRCSAAAGLLATGAAGQVQFKIHSSVKNIPQATENIHISSLSAFARDPLMGSKHYWACIDTLVSSDVIKNLSYFCINWAKK